MRAVLALAGFITITFVAGFNEGAHSLQIGPEDGEVWADQANARVVRGAVDKRKMKKVKKGKKKRNGKKKDKKNRNKKKGDQKIGNKKKRDKKKRDKKRRNRQNKNASKIVKPKQCSSQQADDTCLQNAKDVLTWEGVQVMNFMKQYIRYNNFRNTANNKMGKRFKFDKPMGHMENATGGKDKMTNITCANNTGTSRLSRNNASYDAAMFMETYHTLIDCNATVAAACSIKESTKADEMAECNTDMKKVKDRTKECINATQNHCTCWNTVATTLMEPIKAKKCNTEMTKMIKEMKTAKGACIKAFAKCKQAEDMTSGLVLNCMEFNENDDWNKPEPVKVLPSG